MEFYFQRYGPYEQTFSVSVFPHWSVIRFIFVFMIVKAFHSFRFRAELLNCALTEVVIGISLLYDHCTYLLTYLLRGAGYSLKS